MAYAAWSVSALEVPNASKWNILGTNDAFFNDQVGEDFSSGTTSTVWWEELGRTTLGSAGDTISVASFSARTYLHILWHCVAVTNPIQPVLRFNNDSGSNYSITYSQNYGALTTTTSQTSISVASAASLGCHEGEAKISNYSTQRKMVRAVAVSDANLGAANGSTQIDVTGKWANTSAQITRIDLINSSTGDFDIGSELVILGHD